jgi:hypothetical protein
MLRTVSQSTEKRTPSVSIAPILTSPAVMRVGLVGRHARRRLARALIADGYQARSVELAKLARKLELSPDAMQLDCLVIDLTRDAERRLQQLTRLRSLGLKTPVFAFVPRAMHNDYRLDVLDVSALPEAKSDVLLDLVYERVVLDRDSTHHSRAVGDQSEPSSRVGQAA